MAQDLIATRNDPANLISSPVWLRLRRMRLGTIQGPGEREVKYLADGLRLTDDDRGQAAALIRELEAALEPGDSSGIVAKMLLAYPVAGASFEAGKARGGAYAGALDDVPAWAVRAAIRAWNRGEASGDHDYRWAPAPAVLRDLALVVVKPLRDVLRDLRDLLAAKPLPALLEERQGPKEPLNWPARETSGEPVTGRQFRRDGPSGPMPQPIAVPPAISDELAKRLADAPAPDPAP